MTDSSWDNGGTPRQRGLPLWGKVAIGCGSVLICSVVVVAALIGWGVSKAGNALDQGWAELHQDSESLRTVAGTQALYRANPGLAQVYPTEAAFLKAASGWRLRLGAVPARRPDLKTLFDQRHGGGFGLQSHTANGRKWTELHLRMDTGATLVVELEGDRLANLRVD
jgi:hypothetical protein